MAYTSRKKPEGWKVPTTLKDYGSLPRQERQPKQEIKVRVVKFGDDPQVFVDIREFITNGTFYTLVNGKKVFDDKRRYTGFSHKGLTLTIEQVMELNKIICSIYIYMQNQFTQSVKDGVINATEIPGETKETP